MGGEEVRVERLRVAARPCRPASDGKGKGKGMEKRERERKERAPRRRK